MNHGNILDRDRALLLIVDIQERIAAVMQTREQVLQNSVKLIKGCKIFQLPILYTEQYPNGLGKTELTILELLQGIEPVEKLAFSACCETSFMAILESQKRDQIIITGMETHVCVMQTALDLLQAGYHPYVIADAVCSRHAFDWQMALKRLSQQGATVTTTEAVLFELARISGTDTFKQISRLVK